jgi:DNA-binding MarR family transcriptional regulator
MSDTLISLFRERLRKQVLKISGSEATGGIVVHAFIHLLSNLFENNEIPSELETNLSGPRYGILLNIYFEEERMDCPGTTPTELSRFHNVNKNTISSLLNGLEEQGYISRSIDPTDKRIFRIQLTEAGRKIVQEQAPVRIRHLNQLVSGLTTEEQEQLIGLLGKLFQSIIEQGKSAT